MDFDFTISQIDLLILRLFLIERFTSYSKVESARKFLTYWIFHICIVDRLIIDVADKLMFKNFLRIFINEVNWMHIDITHTVWCCGFCGLAIISCIVYTIFFFI